MINTIQLIDKQLKAILNKIERDNNLKRLYSSKFHKIVNFLYNSTGLKIAKITEGGSGAKLTYTCNSDLDIIFATSKDYIAQEMLVFLEEKANQMFGAVANIRKSSNAVQIDFINPQCDVDLVYKTKNAFNQEFKEIKNIKKLKDVQQNAIKIVKYAFDNTIGDVIHGYEVEKACLQFNLSNLKNLVYSIINYFRGRINQEGLSVNNIIEFLSK